MPVAEELMRDVMVVGSFDNDNPAGIVGFEVVEAVAGVVHVDDVETVEEVAVVAVVEVYYVVEAAAAVVDNLSS